MNRPLFCCFQIIFRHFFLRFFSQILSTLIVKKSRQHWFQKVCKYYFRSLLQKKPMYGFTKKTNVRSFRVCTFCFALNYLLFSNLILNSPLGCRRINGKFF
uniref:Uncharacterized protein n=1 Tax=Cacopsylla melanoneura TaxID=428564 RepID=A0A8D8UFL7_9HEMI